MSQWNDQSVVLGKNCVIDDDVELGRVAGNIKDKKTVIGNNAVIRKGTIIYAGAKLGNRVQTGHNALIREDNIIGDNVKIGSGTELGPRNKIGNNTSIHTGCFLEDVTLGDNVFVGPHVTFTNDPHPSSPKYRDCFKGAEVSDEAIIGGGAIILPHVKIGKKAFIGAGSVVAKDVEDFSVVVGNPARKIKTINDISCNKNGIVHKPYEKYPIS